MRAKQLGGLTIIIAFAGMALVGFARPGQSEDKKANSAEHHKMMLECAKACSDCQRMCDQCSTHCAHKLQEGMKNHMATLMSCQDCATVCAAASEMVSRGGPYSHAICVTCMDVCGKCAAECEKFLDDKMMKACAEECRKCEKACQTMVKHTIGK